MDIFKIISFALIALVLIIIVKEQSKEIAIVLIILSSIGLFIYMLGPLKNILELMTDVVNKTNIDSKYISIIFKVIGISYLIELTKNICTDAGQNALGTKVEIAGKILVVGITIPLITSVIQIINQLL